VTASNPTNHLDLTQELRTRLAEAPRPASTHVEAELQRIASRRLGRGSRQAEAAGAYDSPEGFVFTAGKGRKR